MDEESPMMGAPVMMDEEKKVEYMGGRKRARAHHMGRSMSSHMI
jgi:hypothetical protein